MKNNSIYISNHIYLLILFLMKKLSVNTRANYNFSKFNCNFN